MAVDRWNQTGLGDGVRNLMQARSAQDAAFRNAMAQEEYRLNAMRGMGQYKPYPEPQKPTPHRTPEQIREQLEARLAEMEREAAKPERVFPCSDCRWVSGPTKAWCKQPLVIGVQKESSLTWDEYRNGPKAKLCGPEKALWEPRRTILQRIADWIAR